jgi:hypothetical protein
MNTKLTGQNGKISGKILAIGGVAAGVVVAAIIGISISIGSQNQNDPTTDQLGNGDDTPNVIQTNSPWSDADAQTGTVTRKAGTFSFTVWDAKEMTVDKVQHPGSPKHVINYTSGQSAVSYVPFRVVYTNTNDTTISVAPNVVGAGIDFGDAVIFVAHEGGSYESSADSSVRSVGLSGKVSPGETVTFVGYIEINPSVSSLITIGPAISVTSDNSSRPTIGLMSGETLDR